MGKPESILLHARLQIKALIFYRFLEPEKYSSVSICANPWAKKRF
jgi:hypothetical protein